MSAAEGSRHWWWQRVSALALVPLTLWFTFAILAHLGDDHRVAQGWLAEPGVAIGLSVYLIIVFFHAQLGLQVVIEDYVSSENTRARILLIIKAVNILAAVVAVSAVGFLSLN